MSSEAMTNPVFSITLLLVFLFSGCSLFETPEQTLEKYNRHHAPDSEGMDPLILAGARVVPLIIEKIGDRNMPSARVPLIFLGTENIGKLFLH